MQTYLKFYHPIKIYHAALLLSPVTKRKKIIFSKGVARGGSWGARDPPPFVSLF